MPTAGQNHAQTVRCTSLQEFRDQLRPPGGRPLYPLYRGQADARWALVAPNARYRYQQYKMMGGSVRVDGRSIGNGQVRYFRDLATGMPGVNLDGMSELDVEALARHNGLCSNLLDWTLRPYVALFFAYYVAIDTANQNRLSSGTISGTPICHPTQDIAVWRLTTSSDLFIDNEFEHLHSLSKQNFWQKAQSGSFTRLSHDAHLDIGDYLEYRNLCDHLTKFVLPGPIALSVMAELEDMNITFSTLFPDLRGAALQANCAATWQISA